MKPSSLPYSLPLSLPGFVWVAPRCCGVPCAGPSHRLSKSVKGIRVRVSVKGARKRGASLLSHT